METTTLLTELRETFWKLQSLTQTPSLQKIIEYYSPVVKAPLIINLSSFYTQIIEEARIKRGASTRGLYKKLPMFSPVSETALLEFCQRYGPLLKPKPETMVLRVYETLPVLSRDHAHLPLISVEECINAYLKIPAIWIDGSPTLTVDEYITNWSNAPG
jgi:hypothetical protein